MARKIRIGTDAFAKLNQEVIGDRVNNLIVKAYKLLVEAGVDPYDSVHVIQSFVGLYNAARLVRDRLDKEALAADRRARKRAASRKFPVSGVM